MLISWGCSLLEVIIVRMCGESGCWFEDMGCSCLREEYFRERFWGENGFDFWKE